MFPYLETKTIFQRELVSVSSLNLHFPNKAILSSSKFLIPKPPLEIGKHILSHLIQAVFLFSKSPPHKKFICKDLSFFKIEIGAR